MEAFMVLQSLTLRLAMSGLMVTVATGAFAYTGQELASKAKVKIDDARAIALKARPGAITTEELEKEKGGSGLRYSFGVKSGGAVYEVGVDAQTGRVLENKKEGPHSDRNTRRGGQEDYSDYKPLKTLRFEMIWTLPRHDLPPHRADASVRFPF